ncbi:MAG: polysaccharide deacetylase family protein [Bacillota bacterium]|nr:polysaccharide deacetylase family protein [Bacillota bacterium]
MIGAFSQRSVPAMGSAIQEAGGKKIALTFDDGPHPYYTQQLLKGLKERNVKATFFITGQNVEAYPEIVKEIYAEGHLIGNHTYSHIQLTSKNEESFKQEIVRTNEAIKEVTGQDTIYVRPPYGSWNKEFEKELNMFPVLWTVDPLDWCSSDASRIVRSVCSKAKENDIILMHDQYKTTVTAALKIVDELTKKGYEFVTVDELLFD